MPQISTSNGKATHDEDSPHQLSKETPPEKLLPYLFHGLEIDWQSGKQEIYCPCPFCDKEQTFSFKVSSGLWFCQACTAGRGEKGSPLLRFIRKLWAEVCGPGRVEDFASERNLLSADGLSAWGVRWLPLVNCWVVPGYNQKGELEQLYQYKRVKVTKDGETAERMLLMPTPTLKNKLLGVNLYKKNRPVVNLCEGIWDGVAMWELLGQVREAEVGFERTDNPKLSLLSQTNVLAVPGSGVFFSSWLPLFAGKTVNLFYDNDHPRLNKSGQEVAPAGLRGMQRVASMLLKSPTPPRSINYLCWGEKDYDLNRPSGYDVRDHLGGK